MWGFDPGLYLPILHFARLNRIPVVAVNVERALISEIASKGLAAVPADDARKSSPPATAAKSYRDRLRQVFQEHGSAQRGEAEFDRFIEAQLFWDRAFAEALAAAARVRTIRSWSRIMGSGHLANGDGVPHQLADLGFPRARCCSPWQRIRPVASCRRASRRPYSRSRRPPRRRRASRPLLGVRLEPASDGVRIADVTAGSVAEKAGLKAGDVLREVASRPVRKAGT